MFQLSQSRGLKSTQMMKKNMVTTQEGAKKFGYQNFYSTFAGGAALLNSKPNVTNTSQTPSVQKHWLKKDEPNMGRTVTSNLFLQTSSVGFS